MVCAKWRIHFCDILCAIKVLINCNYMVFHSYINRKQMYLLKMVHNKMTLTRYYEELEC